MIIYKFIEGNFNLTFLILSIISLSGFVIKNILLFLLKRWIPNKNNNRKDNIYVKKFKPINLGCCNNCFKNVVEINKKQNEKNLVIINMYSTEHTDIINKNLKLLSDKADRYVKENQEPKVDERNATYDVLKEFIKKNRIVYGGYAQNSLIKEKNKGDQFYGKFDFPDIEFYTPEPAKDAMELCDELFKNKFKHIRTEQGVHEGTYKIFVNFENVCDIGYIPNNIMNNYPTITIEGMKMTRPELVYIDTLRVYNDPLNSWFRLEKTWSRSNLVLRYYPLKLKINDSRLKLKNDLPEKTYQDVFRFIRKELLHNTKRIVIGHYGYNYLVKKTELTDLVLPKIPFYQIITGNYEHDVRKIHHDLKKKFGTKIKSEEFYPFFEFLGRRTEFYYEKQVILKVYHHNNRCIVYQKSEKKNTFLEDIH